MKLRIWSFLSIAFFLFFTQVKAQLPIMHASLEEYYQALNSIRLQKYSNLSLPLKGIDTLKVAYWHMGGETMLPTLQKYTNIHEVQSIYEPFGDYDVLIVQFDTLSSNTLSELIKAKKANQTKMILVLPEQEVDKAQGPFEVILTSNQPNDLSSSLIAQYIFGGTDLPYMPKVQHALKNYPFRLGYGPAEVVRMDHQILDNEIKAILEDGIQEGAFPGAQVMVVRYGKVVYHQAFGSPTYANKRPLRLDDIYDMASVSKVTTALPALMQLNGQGKFDLDEPLKVLWPKFKKTNKANLTWRSVLAHDARLQPWIPFWQTELRKKPRRNGWRYKRRSFKGHQSRRYPIKITDDLWLHKNYKKKIFKAITKTPLNEKFGYKYSGLSFYILPTIVEQITGEKFEHYLKSKIYRPLGANTLTFNPLNHFSKDRIIPTETDTFFRKEQIHGTVHDEGAIMMGGVNANAGLFGNANDMAKLWQMYLNKGTYAGHKFIKSEVLDEFTKCQYCETENHRGLGFDKPRITFDAAKASYAKDASAATFGHAGYTGTLIWADPEKGLLFIFLSNRVYPTRNNRKLYTLDIRPRLHNAVYSAILN